MDIIHYI